MKSSLIRITISTLVAAAGLTAAGSSPRAQQATRPLVVAATTADLEAIVARVGGDQVVTFHLFEGCVLRRDLAVSEAALERLPSADAVVWSGFFNESSAIHASVEALPEQQRRSLKQPAWIDISLDCARVNVPVSSCEGYVEPQFMHGDPFVWLNPENAGVIARNVADGLGRLRPAQAEGFRANAGRFAVEMEGHLARWRDDLATLEGVKVFFTQCGWLNFARLGGPSIMACRATPGSLPEPQTLAGQIDEQRVDVVVLDPNTPPEYGETFRRSTRATVIVVPSSLRDLPAAKTYPELFDNLISRLRAAVADRAAAPARPSAGEGT